MNATLVVGLGNELLADEGVGVHAARALIAAKTLPPEVRVLEVGTAVLDALEDLAAVERVLIIDAMKAEGEPGTVYELALSDCEFSPCIASIHGFDIQRALALVGCRELPAVWVIGVEPARIEWSMSLSPAVAAALPEVLAAVERRVLNLSRAPTQHPD